MRKYLVHLIVGLAITVGFTSFSMTQTDHTASIKILEDLPHRH